MAGVSVGTVDRVLHNRGDVSLKSKEKVDEVLKSINYEPNMYASALASKRSFIFLAILPEHEPGDYWEKIEEGILKAARELTDFRVSVEMRHFLQYDINSFAQVIEQALAEKPDGILLQ